MKKIIFNWLAVIAWMGVIYYFSAQPNLKSELEPVWDLIFRKIAHMAEFFVLAFLVNRAWISYKVTFSGSLALAVVISVLYATFDEYGHQAIVLGRQASYIDIGIDSLGILAFIILDIGQSKLKQIKKV